MTRSELHTRATPELDGLQTTTRTLVGVDGAPLSLRAAAEQGSGFEGYACLWDTVDAYGTTFAPGTFSRGGLDGELYALLFMHDPSSVIGTFTAREDERGLWIAGDWDDTPEGQSARARAKSGSAPELSVGFRPMMVDPDDADRFTQARLIETSQITARMAAVPGAGFAAARAQLPTGKPEGERQQDDEQRGDDLSGAAAVASVVLALSSRVKGVRR